MTFDEVLDHAIEMLRRRGRVSYRALKRQFDLDEAYIEDLKAEIITVHQLAVDHKGEMLVWTGAAGATPELAPAPPHTAQPPDTQNDRPTPDRRRVSREAPNAERRQLTVMFCDLVGSTTLSGQLDPEDLRDVVRAYQQTCATVIQRFDGHIARYMGDGLLVYFGYPQAHEDDAQRAVRTGLDMMAALPDLNAQLQRRIAALHAWPLQVRIGIHTGLVVVEAVGAGLSREHQALGETPNVAARLQAFATPDTVVISAMTARLVQGYFTSQDLGLQTLKGVRASIHVYRILEESVTQSRFEATQAADLPPLVGREQEITLLVDQWQQAQTGAGRVVLLMGEAGIGKSRITQALREHTVDQPHIRLRYQCSPYYTNSALYPVIAQLERAAQFVRDDPLAAKLDKLEVVLAAAGQPLTEVAPLVAALLSLPSGDRYPPLTMSPQRQKDMTLQVLVDYVARCAAQQPVLFMLEDAHWIDPTTLEWLDMIVAWAQTSRILMVITCRSEFTSPWNHDAHVTSLRLDRLDHTQGVAIIERLTGGKALPAEVRDHIVVKTDGVPLFIEELTKTVLESGLLEEKGDHYTLTGPLPSLAIPTTLQDALMARLDRLAPVKEVAQIGATIGRTFSYALLAMISPLREPELHEAFQQLVQAELLFCRGSPPQATYTFKHALVQDTAYEGMLRSTRQQWHARVAAVLEERFPETVEAEPELLAHHYTEACLYMQAAVFWQRAGEKAIGRSAYGEAIAHLMTGLEVLKALPDTPERTQQELSLYITLGMPLAATKGYGAPDVAQVYSRARALCQLVGETPQLFPVLSALSVFYLVRGELQVARELGEQLLRVAQSVQNSAFLLEAHYALGVALFWRGELVLACRHLKQSLALYDPTQHGSLAFCYGEDAGASPLSYLSMVLWLLGYPDQARMRSDAALALAQELPSPLNLAFILTQAAIVHQFRREGRATQEQTEATMTLATEQGFPHWLAAGTILRGWALAEQGQGEEGMAQMHQGLDAWRAMGAGLTRTYWLALLAEVYGRGGQIGERLNVLTEALEDVDIRGERFYEAELHRLKGELLLDLSAENQTEAEICFQQALDVASRQQAKSLKLRAALSLSRLWQHQDKRSEARQLLAELSAWFTEGFDTADLQAAKALLEELA